MTSTLFDAQRLDKAIKQIESLHGQTHLSEPNGVGTVRVFCADGEEFKFTGEGRVLPVSRSQRKSNGQK